MTEKEAQIDFVKWFSELNKDSGSVAGGKGANLAEIYNLKISVPPGFVITAQAYDCLLKENKLDEKIKALLKKIDYENTKQLDEVTKEIRELITKAKIPKEIEEEILQAYEDLGVEKESFKKGTAHDILRTGAEPGFVAVRSSATTEDLAEASFAGQQDTYLNIKGNTPLLENIKKCFASLFTSRATYYRNKQGFADKKASLAIVIQKMVDSDKSGVIFSKDPSQKNDNIIIEAVFGLGEGIVSGKITPDSYILSQELEILEQKIADKKIAITRDSGGNQETVKLKEEKSKSQVLKNHEIRKLAEIAQTLEEHYKKPQDIEFAIEGEEIFITQTRPITTLQKKIKEGKAISGEIVVSGLAASPGIGVGKIKIIETMQDLQKLNKGDVLVTKMTNPDMVVTMQKCSAIVTDEGGLTSHAAIVSREMGIPAVVGTQEATAKLKEGEIITVDGYTGKIYKGKTAETQQKEVLPVTVKTKTQIKVIVDLPSFAPRAAKSGIKKVGLTRIEGIIAESGKHPEYFLNQNKIKEYEEIIYKGINEIASHFEEVWVRTSDIRTDEYKNLEGAPQKTETNPMLGFHGIRYSLKKPEILKAELNALKRVAEKGKTIGILMPQLILVEELKEVKKILKEIGFNGCKVGIMIETPAAVQLIRELCAEGISFISFGTNDLTQYMLAIDRNNEDVQYLFNEMHPSILYQLEYVIRVCKRNNIETSVCGQAGSNKEMVKFLVEKGIDSISVNADKAAEIAEYIDQVEKNLVAGTDKEPRNYQPENKPFGKVPKQEESKPKLEQPTQALNKGQIEKDIEAIEKEKQEYLEKHPEEESEKAEGEFEQKKPDIEETEEESEKEEEFDEEENKEEVLDIF